jgi:uncharacterized RDD family membrane protein YckC
MESGSPPPEQPGPESPQGPQAPPPKAPPVEETPAYTPIPDGPETPPGGWQQPVATAAGPGWEGKQLASWGSRFAALIIDTILSSIVFWVGIGLAIGGSGAAGGLLIFVGLFLPFFYYPLTMMRSGGHNGQTLGKQMLGIRVIRDSGESIGFWWAVLREFLVKYLLFQVVGGFFFGLPWLLDGLWPLWDSENRALHDMVMSSHVVKA